MTGTPTVPRNRKIADEWTRKYLPLTDDAIRAHLQGKIVLGVYPLLREETCWFLAADFDKASCQEDCAASLKSCHDWHIPASLERSRSGRGGHICIVFETPVPAILARKLGCALLPRTMERRHEIGLDLYHRFFRNQDSMAKGGLGKLIALSLQKAIRDEGKSVFLDGNLEPSADQRVYLSSIRRFTYGEAEAVVNDAQLNGDLVGVRISVAEDDEEPDPWTLPPARNRAEQSIPRSVEMVRANLVFIGRAGLPPAMLNILLRVAAFQNPEFYKAKAMRLSTYDKPRVIACGDVRAIHVGLPRGLLGHAIGILERHSIDVRVRDERVAGAPSALSSTARCGPTNLRRSTR